MNFNSISSQTLQHGLDAVWLKTKVISNNIANYETPGYKAKELDFAEVMNEYGENGIKKKATLRTAVHDDPATAIRPDGNNVNMEKEQLELWKAYSQYSYMVDKMNGEFSKLRYVMKNTAK